MNELSPLPPFWQSALGRFLLHSFGLLLGIVIGALIVFHLFFLSRVLPHGGF